MIVYTILCNAFFPFMIFKGRNTYVNCFLMRTQILRGSSDCQIVWYKTEAQLSKLLIGAILIIY